MMSLKPPRACTRYLSPTRLSVRPYDDRKATTPESPVPARRWKSVNKSQNCRISKGPILPPGVLSYQDILGITKFRANNFSSHKNEEDNTTATADKGQYMDIQSVLKTLASLHIDIPGLLGGFQKLRPKFQRGESRDDSCVESQPALEKETEKRSTTTMAPKPKSNQYWSEDIEHINREQHNFADAMSNVNESVKTYFLDMSASDKEVATQSKSSSSSTSETPTVPSDNTSNESSQAPSLVDQLKQYIPSPSLNMFPGAKSTSKDADIQKRLDLLRKQSEVKSSIDRRTRALVMSLKRATTDASKLSRLEDFCNHLIQNPWAKSLAVKELVIPALLKLMTRSEDLAVKESAHQALTMVGYIFPVKGRGIRILSIDGGGTRGLMAIQIMQEIEKLTGKPIRESFDYICGVSTGALLATMISVNNIPLNECEQLYKQFSKDMFNRSRLVGASKLVTAHAYYDHVIWEKILQEAIGVSSFVDSAKDINCPKLSLVSTLMNRHTVENYLFRNYTYMEGTSSHYPGSYHHKLWEGIRASSAAPAYYQEFKLGDFFHQDGGVLTNNPTAIAIHEARLLWPDVPIQCVISLGTGRYRPTGDPEPTVSLRDKIDKMVQSATDTEAVHTMLQDLLPPSTYFRFNPYLSENFTLDEIREEKWDQMHSVTDMYIRKNGLKIQVAAQVIGLPKLPHHRFRDWAKVSLDAGGRMS